MSDFCTTLRHGRYKRNKLWLLFLSLCAGAFSFARRLRALCGAAVITYGRCSMKRRGGEGRVCPLTAGAGDEILRNTSSLGLGKYLCDTSQGRSVCPSQQVKIIHICSVGTQEETLCWWGKIFPFHSDVLDARCARQFQQITKQMCSATAS